MNLRATIGDDLAIMKYFRKVRRTIILRCAFLE